MAINNDFIVKHGLRVSTTATVNQDLVVSGEIYKNGTPVGYGYTGSLGYTGSIGFTGSQGIQGVTGATGFTGSQGVIGYTGSKGDIGFTGSQGIQGVQGVQGYTGSKGDTGLGFSIAKSYASVAALQADTAPTGIVAGQFAIIETGDVNNAENSRLYLWNGSVYSYVSDLSGSQGITGPQGTTGFTGSQGIQGVAGTTGATGFTGSQGATGFTGSQGATGTNGATGFTGSQGVQGATGFTGSAGATGVTGFTGSAGTNGTNGSAGATGFTGSAGATGFTGSAGATGFTGSAGATGFTGSAGTNGTNGATGFTGSAGPSNVLNAASSVSATVQYVVGVPSAGTDQTPSASTTTPVVFQPSTGNVGVGTNAPAARLDVNGPTASNIVAVAASDIDCSLGNYFTKTINGSTTFTFSNAPASRSYSFVLALTQTSGSVTWPVAVSWPNSTAPTLTTGKTHLFVFVTSDGGTTWRANSSVNY